MSMPMIIETGTGLAYVCPLCKGEGVRTAVSEKVLLEMAKNLAERAEGYGEYNVPQTTHVCPHCFGFGRLPVPSWYTAKP